MTKFTHAENITEAANSVADKFDASIFVYNGKIDLKGFGGLIGTMLPKESPLRPNALLILATPGGDANTAYQIARVFQETFKQFYLFVPHRCKSAGTLIALGAQQIFMTIVAELGPLDVQLTQRDELGQSRSGLVVRTALKGLAEETLKTYEHIMLTIKYKSDDAISFDVASRIAALMATSVMKPVYAQINPEVLGNDLRDLNIAVAYGERLVKKSKNAKGGTIQKLVEGYPSHSFIIDKSEAAELFHYINEPTPEILALHNALSLNIFEDQDRCYVARLDNKKEDPKDDKEASAAEG